MSPRTRTRRKKSFSGRVTFNAREVKVIRLVCAGRVNEEIAAELGVSKSRVVQILWGIYGRAGVFSRVPLAVWAVKQGIV